MRRYWRTERSGSYVIPLKMRYLDAIKRVMEGSRLRKYYAQLSMRRAIQLPHYSTVYALEDLFNRE